MDNRVLKTKYRLYCATESNYVYTDATSPPSQCPFDAQHTIIPSMTTQLNPSRDTIQMVDVIGKTIYGRDHLGLTMGINNSLSVDVQKGAFGSLKVHEDTPMVSASFIYNISEHIVKVTKSIEGSVSHIDNMALLTTGAASNSFAVMETKKFFKYRPGQGGNIMFTCMFSPGVEGSTQLAGIGTSDNGFFFGYNGSNFGICKRRNGVDEWTYMCNWNFDKMNGGGPSGQVLDVTKGNVYKINFQWLGFGSISYQIEESQTGTFVPVHRIAYANANEYTSTGNPSAPLHFEVANTSSTTNIAMKVACCVGYSEGVKMVEGITFGAFNTKTVTSSSEFTNIITIRNKENFCNQRNFIPQILRLLSFSTDGTKNCIINVIKNATIADQVSWIDVNTNESVCQYDISGTSVTGGTVISSFSVFKTDSKSHVMNDMDIHLDPSDTLTVATRLTGEGSNEVSCSLTWIEDR